MATGGASLELKFVSNYLDKTSSSHILSSYKHVIIISDSKGNYLRHQLSKVLNMFDGGCPVTVHFWSVKGRNTRDGVSFVQSVASQGSRILLDPQTIVLFWHVTCDLTSLTRPARILKPSFKTANEMMDVLKPCFDALLQASRQYNFTLGLLESPPIFCSQWNKIRGHQEWDNTDDGFVHEQVDVVNSYIRDLNSTLGYANLGYRSPKFALDCLKFRKSGRNHKFSCYTGVLFQDGVHPLDVVAQKWLYQILQSISW